MQKTYLNNFIKIMYNTSIKSLTRKMFKIIMSLLTSIVF